jgi:murein DD-endopeptidase MepM/ murein hydrolase activator NlpD
MLVPHDNERVRSFQVSAKDIRAIVSAVLLVVFLLGTFSVAFFVKQSQHVRTAALSKENQLLAAEVDQMRGDMQALNASINLLAKKDQQYRVMSGLPEGGDAQMSAGERVAEQVVMHLDPEVGGKVSSASTELETLTRRAALLRTSMDQALNALARNRDRLASTPTIAPANGHLSSLFSGSRYHPVLRISRPHKGIDIAARTGVPILAAAAGRVVFSGNKGNGYGNMVEIDHGYGYVTRYAHASRLAVRAGQQVKRGEVIANVGATGLTSGPHLHYEVELDGRQVDPLNFIVADAIP